MLLPRLYFLPQTSQSLYIVLVLQDERVFWIPVDDGNIFYVFDP